VQSSSRATDKYLPADRVRHQDVLQDLLVERQYLVTAYQNGIVDPGDRRHVEDRIWEIDDLAEELVLGRLAEQYEEATSRMFGGLGCAVVGAALSLIGYASVAESGGRYVVFWGAVVFGLLQALLAWSARHDAARKRAEILRSRHAT